ncbi:MAG: TIGR00282 family metallophosphoesterase [Candidatus Sericytochromatia bacterium]|nr:TIGR00282 family metallophosphoesterase [Candidatus Sericytochromatia bacterium]
MSAPTALDVMVVGDIVGRPGRDALATYMGSLKRQAMPDLVVANGENAAGGFGLTEPVFQDLRDQGVDVVTMGNHTWDKNEIFGFIQDEPRLVRPVNYAPGAPGRGWTLVEVADVPVAVINVMGRVFMPPVDCPFRALDGVLEQVAGRARVILVDVHAEATSEKAALARHLDGRVSACLGTHTHVQTADETILPGGTGFLSDVGMTGPRDAVIGMRADLAIRKMITALPTRMEVAAGPTQFNAVRLRIDTRSGKTLAIERLNYR